MGTALTGNQNGAGTYQLKSLKGLFILFLLINLSCQKKVILESGSFYSIPFAEIVKEQREVKLSEFANGVEIVQLEFSKEAFLGTIENIDFTKNHIFIQCWSQPILQFSRTGKFIRPIGTRGKGPGEYNNCLKMSIDEKGERIYVHTTELNTMVYNFNGKYIKSIQFPAMESMMNFWIWGRDSTLVSYFEPYFGNERFIFKEYNKQGDTEKLTEIQKMYASNKLNFRKMKKIGKLAINAEKVIKNEELVNLKGGYLGCVCICGNGQAIYGPINGEECRADCSGAGFGGGRYMC